jgi:hypothetical protein
MPRLLEALKKEDRWDEGVFQTVWQVGFVAGLHRDLFGRIAGFPDTPWLDLDKNDRDDYLLYAGDIDAISEEFNGVQLHLPEVRHDFKAWIALPRMVARGGVNGWFSVPVGMNRNEILAQFEKQLDRIFAKNPALLSRGRDKAPAHMLRKLGWLRIRDGRSHYNADRFVRDQWGGTVKSDRKQQENQYGGKSIYGKQQSADRARLDAEKHLKSFDELGRRLKECLEPIQFALKGVQRV